MNKSKYITYTTMALVAFIIIEMNLFTFMLVKVRFFREHKQGQADSDRPHSVG